MQKIRLLPQKKNSAHYRHFRIHNEQCDLWSCILNSVIETKSSKKNDNQKFFKLKKMLGNKILLLLLGKTLRFETIAEVSYKWDNWFLTEIIIQLNSHKCI